MQYSSGTETNDPLLRFSVYLNVEVCIRLLSNSFQMCDSKSYRINCNCRNRGLTASMDQSLGITESTERLKSQRSWSYVRIWNCLLKNACISRLHNCKGKESAANSVALSEPADSLNESVSALWPTTSISHPSRVAAGAAVSGGLATAGWTPLTKEQST